MCNCFTGLPASKTTLTQITLAYYLCRNIITGSPQSVRDALRSSPYFDDIKAEDILPLLRPQNSKFADCPREYRGFRQLSVTFVEAKLEFGGGGGSKSISFTPAGSMGGTMGAINSFVTTHFVFDVHYCLRKHSTSKTYEDCYALYEVIGIEISSKDFNLRLSLSLRLDLSKRITYNPRISDDESTRNIRS